MFVVLSFLRYSTVLMHQHFSNGKRNFSLWKSVHCAFIIQFTLAPHLKSLLLEEQHDKSKEMTITMYIEPLNNTKYRVPSAELTHLILCRIFSFCRTTFTSNEINKDETVIGIGNANCFNIKSKSIQLIISDDPRIKSYTTMLCLSSSPSEYIQKFKSEKHKTFVSRRAGDGL